MYLSSRYSLKCDTQDVTCGPGGGRVSEKVAAIAPTPQLSLVTSVGSQVLLY